MRDYLKLWEISELAQRFLSHEDYEEFMREVSADARTCLCAAHGPSECCCGAWDYDEEQENIL